MTLGASGPDRQELVAPTEILLAAVHGSMDNRSILTLYCIVFSRKTCLSVHVSEGTAKEENNHSSNGFIRVSITGLYAEGCGLIPERKNWGCYIFNQNFSIFRRESFLANYLFTIIINPRSFLHPWSFLHPRSFLRMAVIYSCTGDSKSNHSKAYILR